MWGFLIATLPTEVIMVSPGVTPVASKFNLPTEVVTVSMHCFSPPTWLEGVGEPASLSPSLVVGMTQFSAMAGLVAQEVIRSLRASVLISAAGTIMSPLTPHPYTDSGRLVSADKVVGSTSGASSLGVHPSDARMVLTLPWVVEGRGSTTPILAVLDGATVPSGGPLCLDF